MVEISRLTDDFSIGPQIEPDDLAALSEAGFASVLNARPDSEEGEFLRADEAAKLAADNELAYFHSPTDNHAIFETDMIDRFELALAELPKPIFAHCKSGTRAAILWAMVAARHRDVEEVITTLRDAGQDLSFLEDELRDSAKDAERNPFRLKPDLLMSLGTSKLLG